MVVLHGWQRLWIVVCVALLIVLSTLAYDGNFPMENRIRQQHSWELADLRKQLECLRLNPQQAQQPRQSTIDQILSGQPCLAEDATSITQKIAESNQRFEDKLSHLLSLQIESVGWIGAGWLIGCALLYALGALVAWVVRSFRPKGKITS